MVKLVALGLCLILSAAAASAFPREGAARDAEEEERTCTCSGPECQCCVDFNMTYVDLGGPGCITMKYLSKDEGLLVNVSYGDRQLHGGHVKSNGPSMTCMDLLLNLAQMCAKFSNMEVTDEGMTACASLVPSLLGDPQGGFPLGCFAMGSQGMRLIKSTITDATEAPETEATSEGIPENVSSLSSGDALIAAVNESAEVGIAWFSSLLGFNLGNADNRTTTTPPTSSL